MAHLSIDLFSESLEMGQSVDVVMPQPTQGQVGVDAGVRQGPPPVLYLLHGMSDDHTAWVRYTSIERYATTAGIAVVMPAAARSFYTDLPGQAWWTWIADELPELVARFLRVSDRPEETWVAGLSMGGYGALKLALSHPERYAGAASLSGALDVAALAQDELRGPELRDLVFGGEPGPGHDLFRLLDDAVARGRGVPPLHLSCGTGDGLLSGTERFAAAATAHGVAVTLDLRPGEHEWGLWDTVIRDVIDWLPRPGG